MLIPEPQKVSTATPQSAHSHHRDHDHSLHLPTTAIVVVVVAAAVIAVFAASRRVPTIALSHPSPLRRAGAHLALIWLPWDWSLGTRLPFSPSRRAPTLESRDLAKITCKSHMFPHSLRTSFGLAFLAFTHGNLPQLASPLLPSANAALNLRGSTSRYLVVHL